MPHTPLVSALRRLARDHRLAAALRTPPEAVRERRAGRGVTRREVLAGAAAGAALLALDRRAFAKKDAKKDQPRIVVVGAGISGLAAALELSDRGLDATVYESSGRTGGRMFSLASGYWQDGQITEWCGELIDTAHTTIQSLAARFGLPLFDIRAGQPAGSEDTYRFGGRYYRPSEADADFAPVYAALQADLRAAGYPTTWDHNKKGGRALDAMSVYDWIESRVPGGHASTFGALLDVAYDIEYGAETTDQSSLNLVYLLGFQPDPGVFHEFGESDERYRIAGGNQSLPLAIAQYLGTDAVVFGRRLAKLAKKPDAYELTFDTASGPEVVKADIVILTIPFAVLRDLDLSKAGFDDRKMLAIQELGRGRNGKLQMQFTSRYWNQTGAWPAPSTGSTYADTGYQSSWDASRSQAGVRGIFNDYTGGAVTLAQTSTKPFATSADAGVAADVATALPRIEQVFPGIASRWNGRATQSLPHKSPDFNCSYSYWRVGQYASFSGYEAAPQGGVLFAGEHTSTDFQGFMEGAAAEGQRAGREAAKLAKHA